MRLVDIKCKRADSGFTLVEMLVALAITVIIGVSIMTLYIRNLHTYDAQTQVTEAQQNVRAAIESLIFDLRNAGYNPTGATISDLGFVQAGTNVLQVTMDLSDGTGATDPRNPDGDIVDTDDGDGDGNSTEPDPNENIIYSLYPATVNDAYGVPIRRLGRDSGNGNSPVAEYIDAIGFAYALDDGSGNLVTDPNGRVQWNIQDPSGGSNWWYFVDANNDGQFIATDDDVSPADNVIDLADSGIAVTADLNKIRAVKIWVLGRTSRIDKKYTSTQSYVVGNQVLTPNDNFRRRLLSTVVTCRNMGL